MYLSSFSSPPGAVGSYLALPGWIQSHIRPWTGFHHTQLQAFSAVNDTSTGSAGIPHAAKPTKSMFKVFYKKLQNIIPVLTFCLLSPPGSVHLFRSLSWEMGEGKGEQRGEKLWKRPTVFGKCPRSRREEVWWISRLRYFCVCPPLLNVTNLFLWQPGKCWFSLSFAWATQSNLELPANNKVTHSRDFVAVWLLEQSFGNAWSGRQAQLRLRNPVVHIKRGWQK